MRAKNPVPNWLRSSSIVLSLLTLITLESRHRLRRTRENKLRHDLRNLSIAATAGLVMQFAEVPVAFGLADYAQRKRLGLIPRLPLPPAIRSVAALLALDYTLYWWHFLTHRVPLLWRFHRVHHSDLDMDATTALRFHAGEIAISVLFRGAQMLVIGPTPLTVGLWQLFLFVCILFHHSNLELPVAIERTLARLLVTPRLHGIHHSVEPNQVNSNWSSGLSIWDWLHATLRTDVPQREIVIGLEDLRDPADSNLVHSLALPFHGQPTVPAYEGLPVRQPVSLLS